MTFESPISRLEQALNHVKELCDWAYETGFHELGYDPVEELRIALSESGEYICKCGVRVVPHRCQQGTGF